MKTIIKMFLKVLFTIILIVMLIGCLAITVVSGLVIPAIAVYIVCDIIFDWQIVEDSYFNPSITQAICAICIIGIFFWLYFKVIVSGLIDAMEYFAEHFGRIWKLKKININKEGVKNV